MPLVSIITTTLDLIKSNREYLFHKCVSSVLNQKYDNIEYIIQDGMSSDGTKEILEFYKNNKAVSIYYEKDSGIDNAYNRAVKHARGKYIYFLNSDDMIYDSNVISDAVDFLELHEADYVYGNAEVTDRDEKSLFVFRPRMENFWRDMPYSHQAFLVKREVFLSLGGHTEEYGMGGDYDFAIKLILNDNKGVYLDRCIAYYRLGGVSGQDGVCHKLSCIYILSAIMQKLYSQFYKNIDLDQCVKIYHFGESNKEVYPALFLEKLVRFIVQKNLKHYDTENMIHYINNICNINYITCKERIFKYKIFGIIPILKVKMYKNKTSYFLFNFIPLLKVKETHR